MKLIPSPKGILFETIDIYARRLGVSRILIGLAVFLAGYCGAAALADLPRGLPQANPSGPEGNENPWALLCHDYEKALLDLEAENHRLKEKLLESGYGVLTGDGELFFQITLTGYSSTPDQTDSTPFVTASNQRVRPGILALSRDLLRPYNPEGPFRFGDEVEIVGVGTFRVEDTMNARWRRRGDVWFPSRNQALKFGIRQAYLGHKAKSSEG